MFNAIQLRLRDGVYASGMFMLLLSSIIFCIPLMSQSSQDNSFGFFVLNFALAAIYFFVLLVNKRLKKHSRKLHTLFIFLLLFLLSAYALNRQLPVFDNSATWFCIVLVIVSSNYIAFSFLAYIPAWLQHVMSFVLAVSTVVFIYLGVYLIPMYTLSMVASFVLGISLHTFVPLLLSIYSIVLIRRVTIRYPALWISFIAGITCVVALTVSVIAKWNGVVNTINEQYQTEIAGENALPAWVRVAQKVPKGWITERVLKTGLVFNTPTGEFRLWNMPSRNFGEEHKHDPLVVISSLFTERVQLSEEEKINILKSLYNSRNEAEERLWSGEHLTTDHVNTTVQLMPSFRIAYTEKIITVTNSNSRQSWRSEEEAIYTFHLPEGGVVTSLSLWIDGKEEKGILTTKEKAVEAYTTIVGREMRDPSVVHWQEGNRVSVRVFPVLAGESRIFKIGVTSPLELRGSRVQYSNIYFDGPSSTTAKESVKVECNGAANISAPEEFNSKAKGYYKKSGNYNAEWALSFDNKELSDQTFSFNGYSYAVQDYKVEREGADIARVYLDINASWTRGEVMQVFELVKNKKVYVFNDEMKKVNEGELDEVIDELQENRFSLFPFYAIKDPDHSLVITKSADLTPNLDDISNSEFYAQLKNASSLSTKYKVLQIGDQLSPYLQSLKELRWFKYEQGDLGALKNIIDNNTFASEEENNEKVIVHNAGIVLTKTLTDTVGEQGPDHLMRLFTYNHLMQQMGRELWTDSSFKQELVAEAQEANIVSPVSSLIVLETVHDYDRFDIKASKDGLKNASLKSKGAVPEPHEWALIALMVLVIAYIKYPYLFKRKLFGS